MLSRFTIAAALAGALLSLLPLPSRADTASDIKALQAAVKSLQGTVSALQTQNAAQQTQINALKSVTSGFSRVTDTTRTDGKKGTELFLTGFNLHVVNGLGATNGTPSSPDDAGYGVVNGLGNIIIGYNNPSGYDGNGKSNDNRTGSHNLIVGDEHNYSSYGGVVFGYCNTISGPCACVLGGESNTASGEYSSVTCGNGNKASSLYASITGAYDSTASGEHSSVLGGANNTASGTYSSVLGGASNTADGDTSCISGGASNTAHGELSSVSGGICVRENSTYGFAAGGQYSQASPGPGTFHSP